MNPIVRQIIEVFESRGSESYGTEAVTQLQHALQCADLAKESGANDSLIAAAVLHDIGHILQSTPLPTSGDQDYDDQHESVGYQFLREHFGDAVADPVRLHVAAKRYLCTTDRDYEKQLSPTSLKSYHDQGGMMSAEEIAAFEAEPYYREAVRLRYWDDIAKDPDAITAEIEDFMPQLNTALI